MYFTDFATFVNFIKIWPFLPASEAKKGTSRQQEELLLLLVSGGKGPKICPGRLRGRWPFSYLLSNDKRPPAVYTCSSLRHFPKVGYFRVIGVAPHCLVSR